MRRLTSSFHIVLVALVLSGFSGSVAYAQSSIEIFQDKISALEEGLKDIRGVVEEDFRALKQSFEDSEGLSDDDARAIENKISKMIDQIGALNNRIERTLQVATDNEFRLLRLEKRIESMMRMSMDGELTSVPNSTSGATNPSGPTNQGAGDAPAASLSASENNQSNWTIGEETLANEMAKLPNQDDVAQNNLGQGEAAQGETAQDNASSNVQAAAQNSEDDNANVVTEVVEEVAAVSVLPDESPDEQYRFALGKALQNDLDMAELALAEFVTLHPEHERANDATFWLGRVQFMKSSYEKAAMTFTSFNTQWPTDARREKTTLWIAESISYFAPTDEVCDLLESLPNLIEDPTDTFYDRLEKLKTKAACSG